MPGLASFVDEQHAKAFEVYFVEVRSSPGRALSRKCFIHRTLRSNRFVEASVVQVLIKTGLGRLTRRSELLKYVARPGGCKRNAAALGTRCSLTIEEVDAGPPSVTELGLLRVRSQQLGGLWYCGHQPLVLTSRVAVRRLCRRGSGGTVPRNLKRWNSD